MTIPSLDKAHVGWAKYQESYKERLGRMFVQLVAGRSVLDGMEEDQKALFTAILSHQLLFFRHMWELGVFTEDEMTKSVGDALDQAKATSHVRAIVTTNLQRFFSIGDEHGRESDPSNQAG